MAASTPPTAMKTLLRLAYFALVYGFLSAAAPAAGESPSAPYFQIVGNSDERPNEQLPLKSSAAKVSIDGTIARVRLTQRYANSGSVPIEAIYVFPASTRAAVHGMTLTTGGRVIAARVKESVKAKAEYETAKAEKKTAALLEEHRPNVFQMSVANLLPGDDIDVEIEWTETIPAVDSTYEFVFPTVVGPRYTGGSAAAKGETWTANPHLLPGTPNPAVFSLEASLSTTLVLAEVTCPSHPVAVDFKAKDRALVKISSKSGEENANRDFILRWKLGNDRVDAGLLLHRGASTNHFLLQIAPPPRVGLDQIPPRDYVIVLDVSGSMAGFPLDTAKDLLKNLVRGLRSDDTFNVVRFASDSGVLSETPLPACAANIELANQFIDSQTSRGGTELEAALQRSLALPGGENRSRSILLITDGYVSADAETADLIRQNIGAANLFTFGIGGNGAPFEKSIDLAEAAAATGLDHPALPVLWARERVRRLTDGVRRDEETVREITSLGLSYSLLTPYTSFLAIDETPRDFKGVAQAVKQPLPLPKGVSEAAVGGASSIVKNASVPEPGSIGLIAFLVVLLALQRQRDAEA